MFEPISLDMLYTDAQRPQVMIKVNGIDGVCPEFNCEYVYVGATGLVTGQTLSGDDLTITGTNLPTSGVTVKLANSECGTVTATATQITCTLTTSAAAGSWDVKVIDAFGLTPADAATPKINVGLSVTNVSPNVDLNQLGGDILVLTGTGFDTLADNTQIVFGDGTACDVQSTSPTQLECMVAGFDEASLDSSTPYTATVSVNSVTDATQSVQILPTKQSGVSVAPTSVSPVLSSELTVTLESTYPHTLSAADFKAKLVSTTDNTITRPLYIMDADDSAKTIKIKFPGADSGVYHVQVSSTQVGRIDQNPLVLTVEGRVTAFSPASGSALGGTLITIDGVNFSDDPLDNPVKVGNQYCLVQTTSSNQITCRVMETGTA